MRDGIVMDLKVDETLTLAVNDTVRLDVPVEGGVERVAITLEHKSGQVARLRIRAADSITIKRPSRREFASQTG